MNNLLAGNRELERYILMTTGRPLIEQEASCRLIVVISLKRLWLEHVQFKNGKIIACYCVIPHLTSFSNKNSYNIFQS